MKRSKFSEEQIADALRQIEAGTAPANVCEQFEVNESAVERLLHVERERTEPRR